MRFAEAFRAVCESPLFSITFTVVVYWLTDRLWRRLGRPALLNPVLVTITVVSFGIVGFGVDYDTYFGGAKFIDSLLGPATVALAMPLYRERAVIRSSWLMIVSAIFIGAVVAILAGYGITSLLGGSEKLALSMAPKSVTTPIAISISAQIGGNPSLSAIFAVVAGLIGAVVAPTLLTALRISDPRVRGLAIGLASHGVGTARALQESEEAGAFAGLAIGLTGLMTTVAMPLMLLIVS